MCGMASFSCSNYVSGICVLRVLLLKDFGPNLKNAQKIVDVANSRRHMLRRVTACAVGNSIAALQRHTSARSSLMKFTSELKKQTAPNSDADHSTVRLFSEYGRLQAKIDDSHSPSRQDLEEHMMMTTTTMTVTTTRCCDTNNKPANKSTSHAVFSHMTTQSHDSDAKGRSARLAAVTHGSRDTRSKECTAALLTLQRGVSTACVKERSHATVGSGAPLA
jgi:hypothetical protein